MGEVLFNTWSTAVPESRSFGEHQELKALAGWGGLAVMDQGVHQVHLFTAYLTAVQEESCGRCVPCRLGSRLMLDIMRRMAAGEGREDDLGQLRRLCLLARDGSMCEFGRTFPVPLLDALEKQGEVFMRAVQEAKPLPPDDCRYETVVTAPCSQQCPAHLDVPGYVRSIKESVYAAALDTIREKTFLAGVLGRVCAGYCENNCTRHTLDAPLNNRCLQRFVADYETEIRHQPAWPAIAPREEQVAVVGAGPAGLSAAYQLARMGYRVTVYEATDQAGGLLAGAVPTDRLPREVLEREIGFLRDLGVEIKLRISIGRDISWDDLQKIGYQAILIATGRPKMSAGSLAGAETGAVGSLQGLAYLEQVNRGEQVPVGPRVVVLGAGHLALDCARTAVLAGTTQVSMVTDVSREEMTAERMDVAGLESLGVRTLFTAVPRAITVQNGCVAVLEGDGFRLEADTVILAGTREADLSFLPQGETDLRVDPITLVTGLPGVFACGEVVSGEMSAVGAVAAGNRAACSIDQYLREGRVTSVIEEGWQGLPDDLLFGNTRFKAGDAGGRKRQEPQKKPESRETRKQPETQELRGLTPAEQIHDDRQAESTLSRQAALREADRCLHCRRLLLIGT